MPVIDKTDRQKAYLGMAENAGHRLTDRQRAHLGVAEDASDT